MKEAKEHVMYDSTDKNSLKFRLIHSDSYGSLAVPFLLSVSIFAGPIPFAFKCSLRPPAPSQLQGPSHCTLALVKPWAQPHLPCISGLPLSSGRQSDRACWLRLRGHHKLLHRAMSKLNPLFCFPHCFVVLGPHEHPLHCPGHGPRCPALFTPHVQLITSPTDSFP